MPCQQLGGTQLSELSHVPRLMEMTFYLELLVESMGGERYHLVVQSTGFEVRQACIQVLALPRLGHVIESPSEEGGSVLGAAEVKVGGACVALLTTTGAVTLAVPENLRANRDSEASAQVAIILETMG